MEMSPVQLFTSRWDVAVIPDQGDNQKQPLEAEHHGAEPEPHRVAAVVVIDNLITQEKPVYNGRRKDIDGTKEEPKQMNYAKNIVETLKHFPAFNLSAKNFYKEWNVNMFKSFITFEILIHFSYEYCCQLWQPWATIIRADEIIDVFVADLCDDDEEEDDAGDSDAHQVAGEQGNNHAGGV